jgi:hypothetical protein
MNGDGVAAALPAPVNEEEITGADQPCRRRHVPVHGNGGL